MIDATIYLNFKSGAIELSSRFLPKIRINIINSSIVRAAVQFRVRIKERKDEDREDAEMIFTIEQEIRRVPPVFTEVLVTNIGGNRWTLHQSLLSEFNGSFDPKDPRFKIFEFLIVAKSCTQRTALAFKYAKSR